jgi:DNA primase
VSELVVLLGKLPASAVRSRYLQQVAERLSGGQARLALQLEDDLRQQVKGQRWHGRSQRWEQPGEAGLRERAEAELLRLYLHCPSHRGTIRAELRRRELDDFAIAHHRQLWAAISALEEDNLGVGRLETINRGSDPGVELADLDLPRLLSDQLLLSDAESPADLLTRLTPLLEPSDVQRLALANPLLQLRGATASLERQRSLKRCRHLLNAWSAQRLETLERCIARLLEEGHAAAEPEPGSALQPVALDMEARIEAMFADLNGDALRFQELYYNERQHITHLDQQRRAGFEDVLQEQADSLTA